MIPGTVPIPFHIRTEKFGDTAVIEEVVTGDCYKLAKLKKSGFEPKTIVDIGAHIGTFAVLAHLHWPEAKVYCLEPNERSYELLCQNAPFAVAYNCAAFYGGERMVLTDGEGATGGGFLSTKENFLRKQASAQGLAFPYSIVAEQVPTMTLEQLIAEHDLQSIDLLKLDCEGSEFNVMQNASPASLAMVRRAVGEYHHPRGFDYFVEIAGRAFPHLAVENVHRGPIGPFFLKPRVQESRPAARRLEIGSGARPQTGYEHLDIDPKAPDVQYRAPMDKIPCEDNTFDEVRSTHVIEHVPMAAARKALKEWYRVLRPGGFCHIDTPNLERNVKMYCSGEWQEDFVNLHPDEQKMVSIDGVPSKALWLNFKVFSAGNDQWNIHYASYDAKLLEAFCREAGFTRVEVYQREPSLIVHAWK